MNNLIMSFDCNPDTDDIAQFYSREFSGGRVVIVPKENFDITETPTTFVLTLKNNNNLC